MDKDKKTLHEEPFTDTVAGFPRTQYALVTHSGLASVVRLAIRNHPWAGWNSASAKDVMALASNWNNVEDPPLGSGIMTLVRVAYEQFPCQEQMVGTQLLQLEGSPVAHRLWNICGYGEKLHL